MSGVTGRDAGHYPMALVVLPGARLRIALDYRPDLFSRQAARKIAGRLVRVLGQVAGDPRMAVGRVEVLDPAERRVLLGEWNDTGVAAPDVVLPGLFGLCAARAPDAVAVVCGPVAWTYRELDERSARVAAAVAAAGGGLESVVAVAVGRSAEMMAAILGVVRAGAAYLPVDAGIPAARVGAMVADARPACLVTTVGAGELAGTEHLPRVLVDDLEPGRAGGRAGAGAGRG